MTTITDAGAIPALGHAEAMRLAATEADRMLDVVGRLDDGQWTLPTDCVGWDVKALLSHVLGAYEGISSRRDFVRQYVLAVRASKRSGGQMIDEMTARQVRLHERYAPAEMTGLLRDYAPKAVHGRTRLSAVVRSVRFSPGPPVEGTWTFGHLVDVIMGRDFWMHRVDLTRATGTGLALTPEHDGRIVADAVAEWARTHGRPFDLCSTARPADGSARAPVGSR